MGYDRNMHYYAKQISFLARFINEMLYFQIKCLSLWQYNII